MANWRNLFKPWILVRGKEYFECGQVAELKEVGSVVTAEVSGNRAYYVEIHRSGERVTRMSCDCPPSRRRRKLQAYGGGFICAG